MSRKGIRNKLKEKYSKKVTGPKCSQCGRIRKGMKQYKNPYNGKHELMHKLCHTELVLKHKRALRMVWGTKGRGFNRIPGPLFAPAPAPGRARERSPILTTNGCSFKINDIMTTDAATLTTCPPTEGEVRVTITGAYWRSLSIKEKQAEFDEWYRHEHSALLARFKLMTGEKPSAFGRGPLSKMKPRDPGLDHF